MYNVILLIVAAVFISVESQNLSVVDQVHEGQSVTLKCTTIDFTDNIYFQRNTQNKGGCLAGEGGLCQTGVSGYQTPSRNGTTVTQMIITSYNTSRDGGNWTCTYGSLQSNPVTVQLSDILPGPTSTNGPTGNGDVLWPGHYLVIVAIMAAPVTPIIVLAIIYMVLKPYDLKISIHENNGCIKHVLTWLPIKKLPCGDVTYKVEVEKNNCTGHRFSNYCNTKKTCTEINASENFQFRVKAKVWFFYSRPTNAVRLDTIKVKKKAIAGKDVNLLEKELINQHAIQNVKWYFGEEAITADGKKYENGNPDMPALLIYKLAWKDFGIYSCNLMLKDGSCKNYVVQLEIDFKK